MNKCWYYLKTFPAASINKSDFIDDSLLLKDFDFKTVNHSQILNQQISNWFNKYNLIPTEFFIFSRKINVDSTYHVDMSILPGGLPYSLHKCAINIELLGSGIQNFYYSAIKGLLLVDSNKKFASYDFNKEHLTLLDTCKFRNVSLVKTDVVHHVKSQTSNRVVLSIRFTDKNNKFLSLEETKHILSKEAYR